MGSKARWPLATGRQTVLVVEDEPLQRLMALDLVEEAGFAAVPAASAQQALRVLESRTDIIIVFTDIDLPGGLDGMRLAAMIRDRWPPIQFIVTSGHMATDAVLLPPNSQFFAKPYQHERIVQALRQMAS
jgi:DNA-binding NtrC family response regulator